MDNDFLYRYNIELETEKEKCLTELKNLQYKLKECMYYLDTYESISDENYKSFSPRKINTDHDNKIELYKDEIKKIRKLLHQKTLEVDLLDNKISELNNYIKFTKENSEICKVNKSVVDEDLSKILEIQEDERGRIARDLHDTVVQNMTHLIHKVELSAKLVDIDPIRSKLELSKMELNIRNVIEELRKVIYNLHPMILDDIGLDVLISHELDKIKEISSFDIKYLVNGYVKDVKPIIGITLLRIVQESFNNIIKHANATKVNVTLNFLNDAVEVVIEDNGIGFCLDNELKLFDKKDNSFGIKIMEERVYLLSGDISIKSKLEEGTFICVKIPI